MGDQKVPLCLNCHEIFQRGIARNVEMLREEMNHTMDHVDAMFGIPLGPRYPTKRPVIVSGGTVNNNRIAISNSQIGILNTGNINSLNQTIGALYSSSQQDLAQKIKVFSESVLKDESFGDDQRKVILESLDTVTKELLQEQGSRKGSVAKLLLKSISETVQFGANSATLWQALSPLLAAFF